MSDLLKIPELAVDQQRHHFATHPDMVLWKVVLVTVGHSFNLGDEGEVLFIPRETPLVRFQEIVGNRPGFYKLIQCDENGVELGGHVAYVEIHARSLGSQRQSYTAEHAVAMADRMARTSEHAMSLMANLTDRLMTTHVEIQANAAKLMEAATGAIRVTSGIERIERDKPLDVEQICARVVEAIDAREPPTPPPPEHWFWKFANGPIGAKAMQFMMDYAKSIQEQQARQNRKSDSEE